LNSLPDLAFQLLEFAGYKLSDPAVLAATVVFLEALTDPVVFLVEMLSPGGPSGPLIDGLIGTVTQAENSPPPAPEPPPPPRAPTGVIYADPHLLTYDGLQYDFQAAGEFVLAKGTGASTFQVQVRLVPYPGSDASFIMQAAMQVGSDRVTIDPSRAQPLWVDGAPATLGANNTLALAGGQIQLVGNEYTITYNTGEIVRVVSWQNAGLNVAVTLGPNEGPGSVQGLLGNDNGNPAYDLALPDGTILPQPISSSTLYGVYANAWRVTQATSLFDYASGQSTATFTDTTFPQNPITLSQFPASAVAQAAALVQQAGITDPGLQQSAEYDYLVTGNPTFITEDAALQQAGATTTTTAQVTVPSAPPLIGVDAPQASSAEAATGATSVSFQVYLTQTTSAAVTVDYAATSPGSGYVDASAFGGTLPSGQVTIAAGQQTGNFTVSLPAGIGAQASAILQVQVSDASGIGIAAPTAQVTITNNQATPGPQAVPGFVEVAGKGQLTQNGNAWSLNLGTIAEGATVSPIELAAINMASAPADSLSGSFTASSTPGFTANLSAAFANLAPGAIWDFVALDVNTATAGTNTETVTLNALDVNSTGYTGLLPVQTLTITDTIAAPQSGTPAITAPATATVGVGQAGAIAGVSIAESPTTSGESFTAVLADSNGVVSANTGATGGGGTITPSNGGTTLTIAGTLAQVNADLTTLTDTDGTTPSDTIMVNASDSNGGKATAATIAVTVNGVPVIAAPATATLQQNQATAISGVSVSETGNTTTSGESFTAVLADSTGVLSANAGATGGGGTITPSNGGKTLTIAGTLAQVDADLTTLTDDDPSTAADTITVNASDSFGNAASQKSIAVSVTPQSGTPSITAPAMATVGVGRAGAIAGISITESPTISGETFSAVLADANGVLSASAAGGATVTPSNGGKTLTIAGTLSQVNTALGMLSDTDATTPSDTITVKASDSNGGTASPQSIAVTVNGVPVIAAPATTTVQQNQATAISGVSIAETGNTTTSGESFTAVLADGNGVLSANNGATGGGGTITPSNGGKTLTIAGTLAQVDADLTTLTDDDPSTTADTITVNASDSFGNAASQKSIAITVTAQPSGPTAGNAHLYIAPSQSFDLTSPLLALDTPGRPGDTLRLTAVGTSGTKGTVTLDNGDLTYTAPASGSADAFTYTVSDQQLQESATGDVNVTLDPNLLKNDNITLTGSGNIVDGGNGNDSVSGSGTTNNDTVMLGGGNDSVTLTGNSNTVTLGGGNDMVSLSGNNDTLTASGNGNDNVSLTGNNGTLTLGSGNDSVSLSGSNDTLTTPGNGNDNVSLTGNNGTLTLGGGNDNVSLIGNSDTLTLGNGNDTVMVSGTGESVTAGTGNDTFTLGNNSTTSLVLNGQHDTVSVSGGTDSITDTPGSVDQLMLHVGALGGTVSVANFSPAHGVLLLAQALATAEHWTTPGQVDAALGTDGHGGSLLSLGTLGAIDFQNVPKTQLSASNFQIH
jgi:von Willebrand factor type D domain/Bacterial Ig domain